MTKKQVDSKGLRGTVILLFVLLIAVGLVAGLSMQMREQGEILTYEDCEKASGSMIQESYPEVCVTKDGQRFTNPAQQPPCYRGNLTAPDPGCR